MGKRGRGETGKRGNGEEGHLGTKVAEAYLRVTGAGPDVRKAEMGKRAKKTGDEN